MHTFFLVCALLGGAVLALQLALGLLGFDHGALDLDAPGGDVGEGLQLFSVRSVSAGLAFFGFGGMALLALGAPLWLALTLAVCIGTGAAVGVAVLMRSILALESDGTVHVERSLGQPGTVYLRIPGERAGAGKVLLTLQGRTVEYQAVTAAADELPTGAAVVVVDVIGPDTVEVVPAPQLGDLTDAASYR